MSEALIYYITDGSRVIKTFYTYREAHEYFATLRIDLVPVDYDERAAIAAALTDTTPQKGTNNE